LAAERRFGRDALPDDAEASMGPQLVGCGKDFSLRWANDDLRRFNGAAARWLRKGLA